MEITTIKCDHCLKELSTESSMPARYVFEVKCINVNKNTTGITFASCIAPPTKDTLHFCDHLCISEFFDTFLKDEPTLETLDFSKVLSNKNNI